MDRSRALRVAGSKRVELAGTTAHVALDPWTTPLKVEATLEGNRKATATLEPGATQAHLASAAKTKVGAVATTTATGDHDQARSPRQPLRDAMNARAVLVLIASASAAIAIVASCTVFDGLDGKVIGGGSDAAGDVVDEQTLLAGEQVGYLSLADGVSFCSNAFACPNLTDDGEFSVDVPVDSNHFSSCVDWVSGPLPKDRTRPRRDGAAS